MRTGFVSRVDLCRPYGARRRRDADPALPRWAKLWRATGAEWARDAVRGGPQRKRRPPQTVAATQATGREPNRDNCKVVRI